LKTKQQLKQRKVQTVAAKVKKHDRMAAGLCCCGAHRELIRWRMCASCREKARVMYYGVHALPRKKHPLSKNIPKDCVEVKRRNQADGYGNVNLWWVASCVVKKKMHCRRWSVNKHGDQKAFKLAFEQRQEWVNLRELLE
jgi:hypothetical protein